MLQQSQATQSKKGGRKSKRGKHLPLSPQAEASLEDGVQLRRQDSFIISTNITGRGSNSSRERDDQRKPKSSPNLMPRVLSPRNRILGKSNNNANKSNSLLVGIRLRQRQPPKLRSPADPVDLDELAAS